MAVILPEGIYPGIPEAVYHADPCQEPSASASVLRTLYDRSPEHAYTIHPRLNPKWQPDESTDAKDAGTILHALILGTDNPFRALAFDNYQTKAAREARDEAREQGLIPILEYKLDELRATAEGIQGVLERDHPNVWEALMDPGTEEEVTAIWRDNRVLCRCRFDVLPPPRYGATYDFKFTGISAEPGLWSNKVKSDYLFQSALYPRAIHALRGDAPEFRFIACETEPPYGVSIHAADPEVVAIGARRVERALTIWRECMETGKWPGYTPLVHYATAPAWFIAQDDERAVREQIARDLTKPKYDPHSLADHPFPFA